MTGPAVHGYIDLDTLVRLDPGWRNVSQFDAALVRLRRTNEDLSNLKSGDTSLTVLPAIDVRAPQVPGVETSAERARLQRVADAQIGSLIIQRATARNLQLNREQRLWQLEADRKYRIALQTIEQNYGIRYNRIYSEQEQRRLTLILQIDALKKIIEHWSLPASTVIQPVDTKYLTAAELEEDNRRRHLVEIGVSLSKELTAKKVELSLLGSDRQALVNEAQSARGKDIQAAYEASRAYVAAQRSLADTALRVQDDRQIANEKHDLEVQRNALLAEIKHSETTSVPEAGSLGNQTLSPVSSETAVSLPVKNLTDAGKNLTAQRTRWIAALYQETRAATENIAKENNWIVTYTRSQSTGSDLTPQAAKILVTGLWKR